MDPRLFMWTLILIGVILLASTAVVLLRRMYFRTENFPHEGFTIDDLRQLRQSGQMSPEEFEKAKAALLAAQMRSSSQPSDKPRQ